MKAAIMAVLLAGCATPDFMYKWERTHEPLPFTWHIVPQEAVQAYCSDYNGYAMACAYWIENDHCWIFTASEWNMRVSKAHEERHCAGWNH
jgi:hypothetical protein